MLKFGVRDSSWVKSIPVVIIDAQARSGSASISLNCDLFDKPPTGVAGGQSQQPAGRDDDAAYGKL